MNKRRRSSVNSSRQEQSSDDDSEPEQSPLPVARKKKKMDPSELCQQLYDSIRSFKKEDGSMLCDTFVRAPKRRQEPSYYDVVANPIDLLKIQQKLKTESYDDIDELNTDVELLVNNAKAFYKPDSSEYKDACTLLEMFRANKAKLLDSLPQGSDAVPDKRTGRGRKSLNTEMDDSTSDQPEVDMDLLEEMFASVMQARDPINEDRCLHLQFQLLPSKKLYPDYYDVIEHPIDLKLIATKIQRSAYASLGDMEKDLLQMVKNACTFNEPGSQIYKDAKSLKKIFLAKKNDIENGKVRKTQIKKEKGALNFSAKIASLKEEAESSDDDADDLMETEGNGPIWQLFDQLYNTANIAGAPLGESLWKLPNRRFNPDYYTIVKKPISMAQIRNKLKKGTYSVITDMTADLYLMLDNAKKAIPPQKQTYKDAVKMQKILNQKLIDNGLDMEDTESEDTTDSTSIQQMPTSASSSVPSTPQNTSHFNNANNPSTPSPAATSFTGIVTTEKKKKGRPRLYPVGTTPTTVGMASPTTKVRVPNHALALKKKLLALHKYFLEFTIEDRKPMQLFLEKPSKKLYPDYYKVINHPIDMTTIEAQIKGDYYASMDDVVSDYRLMFMNCRNYNEEGSVIYDDANVMELALNEKLKEFSGLDKRLNKKGVKTARKALSQIEPKLRVLYDAIRDYREPKSGRQLALIFMKLPSKNDYPDYYDIIKHPIDMEKISLKLNKHQYENVEEIASDFMLMFENACKYNEPDSQIYKDSLLLQQLCIQTKQSLKDTDESVPDVGQAVQELLLSLFTTLYNFQDEESRCYSDSLSELPEHDDVENTKVRGISLDLIKRRLDKGLYKRLDTFQEDIFSCLERARKLSRTDSQVFEDSIELQSFFIRKRDELCKNGDALTSPALSYSAMHLSAAVEAVRQSKLLQEGGAEPDNDDTLPTTQSGESMMIHEMIYSPGDFVLFELTDNKVPGIMRIERLWTNNENIKMMQGNIYLRPYETYHLQTRKFMEQEVFRSEQHQAEPLEKIRGKCFVMNVKDYFKSRPEGFADKDVFVCESRYHSKSRMFKKIKNWGSANSVKVVARDQPLEVKRVQSVFRERVEKHKVELSELSLQEALVEKEKPNVVVYVTGNEDGNTYYEQYNTICSGVVKTGDFVYVATESGKQSIAQIQSLWETKDGKSFFRGPWLLTPPEVPGTISKLFYRQEVMLSTVQETTPTVAIVGRCSVLDYCEYITRRPTEISESDIYLCEAIYDELKKQIQKTFGSSGHLRKFVHSQMVTPDEIYFFKHHIMPPKVSCGEIVAQQEKTSLQDLNNRNISMDCDFTVEDCSIDSAYIGSDLQTNASPVPSAFNHFRGSPIKINLTTGFSLYSSARLLKPNCKFSDIGQEWRALSEKQRQVFEERASKINLTSFSNLSKKDIKSESMDLGLLGIADDSLDSPSVGSDFQTSASPAPSASNLSQTPIIKKGRGPKVITGYILYASARRKNVTFSNPEARFGEISRMIGNEWRSMEQTDRQVYEDRASKINGVNAAKYHLEHPNGNGVYEAPSILNREILPNQVFECCWGKCDYQFEDPADCLEHCTSADGCVAKHFMGQAAPIFHCFWRGCIRIKRSSPAFPHIKRLMKHVTDVHVNKSTGRIIQPERQSKNYQKKREKPIVEPVVLPPSIIHTINQSQGGMQQMQPTQQMQQKMMPVINPSSILNVAQAPPAEPLFVTVPPRPQRVLHSEAYIKYIEGLQTNTHYISPYEKTLKATQENVQAVDISKLPTSWLGKRAKDKPEEVVNALWELRNYMMKDILQLHRTY